MDLPASAVSAKQTHLPSKSASITLHECRCPPLATNASSRYLSKPSLIPKVDKPLHLDAKYSKSATYTAPNVSYQEYGLQR